MEPAPRHRAYRDYLQRQLGDDLMGVGAARRDGEQAAFEVLYLRDDVAAMLDDATLERIADEVVFHALEEHYRRDSFGFGPMEYAINRYRGTIAVVHGDGDGAGTLASLDPETDADPVAVAERGRAILDGDEG